MVTPSTVVESPTDTDDPFMQDTHYQSVEALEDDQDSWQLEGDQLLGDPFLSDISSTDSIGLGNDSLGMSDINPATGLTMCGGIDVAGNPYGFDNSSIGSDSLSGGGDSGFDTGISSGFDSDIGSSFGSGMDSDFGDSFDSGFSSGFDDW